MAQGIITVNSHYGNKDLDEIIKKLVYEKSSINKIETIGASNSSLKLKKTFKCIHIFSGMLKCNECGGNMSYKERYRGYKCTNSQKGGGRCTAHSIKEDYLLEVIKNNLRSYMENKVDRVGMYKMENKKAITADGYRKELKKIERELQKIEKQFEIMCSDKIQGLISDKSFENLMRALRKRQQFLIIKKSNVEGLKERSEDESELYYENYKEEMDRVLGLNTIDKSIIEVLIDKIIVSENRFLEEKKVDIYYKFKI